MLLTAGLAAYFPDGHITETGTYRELVRVLIIALYQLTLPISTGTVRKFTLPHAHGCAAARSRRGTEPYDHSPRY